MTLRTRVVTDFLPWSTNFLILVVRHSPPTSYNITGLQGPRIHTASHLLFVLQHNLSFGARAFVILKNMELFTFADPKHALLSDVFKSHYIHSAYPASYRSPQCTLILF